ncbi:peptidoglycan D,D-transpeptidase FtsI family protein [Coxiella endosymbiont of Amblyomma americanum]|uniref:peptidoglycan D,D-transpeptidase FtsI family protein n=1 Tax=Coxiella endosymbiont of Amblyomma americanum TaxID=325775 RepID=UPI000581F278|nr:penicillin-binding protein 2 [Coxiella endosymbiont of Amblyomma americanum]AJC50388.1 cell division protein [Coxiella endosymbiont of Amblyomma americanum]AUJ58729.1 cell division protein [Coxiella-like endosymbiont of Amblyomma americanum]
MHVQKACRFFGLWFLLCITVIGLLWRLIDLNIFYRSFLLKQSKARTFRVIKIPVYRGMITDRLGTPLAISVPVNSVWVNPRLFQATSSQLSALSYFLHMPAFLIKTRIQKELRRQFIYLKRDNSSYISRKIRQLNISGVFVQRENKRYYPEGEITAHVVGFTNIDDQGQEGLELAYNQWLSGKSGRAEVVKDRLGYIVTEDCSLMKQPILGHNLILSLDHRIQYVAYQALKETVSAYHAKSGSVIVLNVKNGEILAMVNQPSYNPNNRPLHYNSHYRNRAVTDMFEPGSVIKAFTVISALENGKYTPNTKIDTNPGWMKIGNYRISDNGSNFGVISLTQLLQYSSNIAAAKVLLSLKPSNYYSLLRKLGFGQRTSSGFPGESSGKLISHNVWTPTMVATLGYGYGMAVTAIQLAQAYAILGSGGISRPITFIKIQHTPVIGVRVLSERIAKAVIEMLKAVIKKGGTGTRAAVHGYCVAGKTGTAYISGLHGYDRQHYIASFVGIAPADNPKLVVAVVIRDPKGEHFGGLIAAPLFSKIMSKVLYFFDDY